MNSPLIRLSRIHKSYKARDGKIKRVLENVSLTIDHGEAVGLCGASGSGKSTFGRIALGLEPPDEGEIFFMGKKVELNTVSQKKAYYRYVQMVWQDPVIYLNPHQSVSASVMEPLKSFKVGMDKSYREKAGELMEMVGLPASVGNRKPSGLSGGQCQRVALARALAVNPKLLIMDEALVNLDLPQQVDILKLMKRFQKIRGLSLLFISHDMDTVRALCTRTISFD